MHVLPPLQIWNSWKLNILTHVHWLTPPLGLLKVFFNRFVHLLELLFQREIGGSLLQVQFLLAELRHWRILLAELRTWSSMRHVINQPFPFRTWLEVIPSLLAFSWLEDKRIHATFHSLCSQCEKLSRKLVGTVRLSILRLFEIYIFPSMLHLWSSYGCFMLLTLACMLEFNPFQKRGENFN